MQSKGDRQMSEKKDKTDVRQGVRKPGQERVLRRSLIFSAIALVAALVAVLVWRAL
jgi:hypothetical protein